MLRYILLLGLLMACSRETESELKIVGGQTADPRVSQSTVALQDAEGSFCTGSLIAPQLVLTAAHCVVGKDIANYEVRFVDGNLRSVTEMQSYKAEQKYGVNFDIAWVRLEGEAPASAQPIALEKDAAPLSAAPLAVAGYGQTRSRCAKDDLACQAGSLYQTEATLTQNLNEGRWFHLLLTQSEPGTGPCLGDSGGPLLVERDGQLKLAGTFVGWDKRLVAENVLSICDQGVGIYTFAGAYISWIERTSGVDLGGADEPALAPAPEPKTFADWCASRDHENAGWYTVQRLLMLASENAETEGRDYRRVFTDCAYGEQELRTLIKAQGTLELTERATTSFGDQATLESLKPFESLSDFGVKTVILAGHAIRDFSPLTQLGQLRRLEISQNSVRADVPLPLDRISKLDTLRIKLAPGSLASSELGLLSNLRTLEWTDESEGQAASINLSNLGKLEVLNVSAKSEVVLADRLPQLRVLQISNVKGVNIPLALPKLKSLLLSNLRLHGNGTLDINSYKELEELAFDKLLGLETLDSISGLAKIYRLTITNSSLSSLGAFENLPRITRLDLSGNQLDALPLFVGMNGLTRLDVRKNRISSLDGIAALTRLDTLDLSLNPIDRFAELSENQALRRLSINEMQSGTLDDLASLKLSNLTEIRAGGNAFRSTKTFLRYPKLEVLVISNNEIQSLNPLAALKQLTYLEAVNNPLQDQSCPLAQATYCRFEWARGMQPLGEQK